MHHDVRSILVQDSTAYYLTRYGITTMDYSDDTTSDQWFPQGVEGHEAIFVESESGPHSIAIATSHGVHVAALQVMDSSNHWSHGHPQNLSNSSHSSSLQLKVLVSRSSL